MFKPDESITLNSSSYRIISKLGAGAQVQAWKVARQPDGEYFAVRVVNPYDDRAGRQVRRSPAMVDSLNQRMRDEVAFLRLLPNAHQYHIVPCLDAGVVDYLGSPLEAMVAPLMPDVLSNYCPSLTLHPKPFSLGQWLLWIRQLATALVHIHQRDSNDTPHVHRDLKPSNILLDEDGNAFLSDFGILKAARHIGTTSVAFSPECCAPEQRLPLYLWEEEDNGRKRQKRQYLITPKADIYALGMVIHNLLMGNTAAQDESAEEGTIDTHVREIPTLSVAPTSPMPVGALGKLGGLLVAEQKALRNRLVSWLRPSISNNGTYMPQDSTDDVPSLPDYPWLAERMTGFINQMLRPWPEHRPDAQAVLAEVIAWDTLLFPVLEMIELTGETAYPMGEPLVFMLLYRGVGLEDGGSHFPWLQVTVDGQRVVASWMRSSPDGQCLMLTLGKPLSTGKHDISVGAWVGGLLYEAQHVFDVVMSAQQLWDAGQHEQALVHELRQEWLAQLLGTQASTVARYQYMQLLERLKTSHPGQVGLLDSFLDQADNLSGTKIKAAPLRKVMLQRFSLLSPGRLKMKATPLRKIMLLAAGVGTLSLLWVGWFVGDKPVTEVKLLGQFPVAPDQSITYTQLLELANGNNPNAQAWLGYRYLIGDGVGKDLQEAKKWYKKAADAGSAPAQQQLEEINRAIAVMPMSQGSQ